MKFEQINFARLVLSRLILILTAVLVLVALPHIAAIEVLAQQSMQAERLPASTSNVSDDMRYKIGPGDVLTVLVRKTPELSLEAIRVDQRGMISIPMIHEQVQAACRTESELADVIAKLYLQYKRNPSVAVFVREFQSVPVAVIGAVTNPGQFRLQRQVR